MADWNRQNDRRLREAYLAKITGEIALAERTALQTAEAVNEAARFMRQMREQAKLTQKELGKKLGVSQERICELEKGGSPEGMSYALLRRAAIECGLSDWPAVPQFVAKIATETRKQRSELGGVGGFTSTIDAHTVVNGPLNSSGDVLIDGRVQGDVQASSVTIGDAAFVNGDVVAENVVVCGRVQGNIRGLKVLLCRSSHVEGNILHGAFAIETGAFFEGNCRHSESPLPDGFNVESEDFSASAVPTGANVAAVKSRI